MENKWTESHRCCVNEPCGFPTKWEMVTPKIIIHLSSYDSFWEQHGWRVTANGMPDKKIEMPIDTEVHIMQQIALDYVRGYFQSVVDSIPNPPEQ